MHKLKLCRICLRINVKVYKNDSFQLKSYYEEIMAINIPHDKLPQYFCYECAALLYKYHKFKQKCQTGQKILQNILKEGPLRHETILNLNRQAYGLKSPIDLLRVNDRVKTILLQDKNNVKRKQKRNRIEHIEINQHIIDEGISDNDLQLDYKLQNRVTYAADIGEVEHRETKHYEKKLSLTDIKPVDQENKLIDGQNISIDGKKISIDGKILSIDEQTINVEDKNVSQNDQRELKGTKRRHRTKVIKDSVEKKFQSTKKRKNFLDSSKWEKICLREDEAIQMFKLRSQETSYLNAAYKCADCYKGFSKGEILNRHMQLTHSISRGKIECHFCRARFKWKSFLRPHILQHYTKYKCLQCGKLCAQESTAYFHEQYHKGITRKCMHCGEEFGHASTYYTHLRSHRSEHVCALCGASFVSEVGLHQHKKVKHVTKDAEIPNNEDGQQANTFCEKCNIKFETTMAYDKHFVHSAMHADEVDPASGTAKHSTDKKKRIARRSARKPTTCYVCNRHFETQQAYLQHHLKMHPRTPFHSPGERHICEICGVSLAPMSVPIHMNIHTREKLYKCSICEMQFSCKSTLNRHHVTHTGEKKYGCSLCPKRFTQSGSMKLHYRTFHLKEPYPRRNRSKKCEVPPEY